MTCVCARRHPIERGIERGSAAVSNTPCFHGIDRSLDGVLVSSATILCRAPMFMYAQTGIPLLGQPANHRQEILRFFSAGGLPTKSSQPLSTQTPGIRFCLPSVVRNPCVNYLSRTGAGVPPLFRFFLACFVLEICTRAGDSNHQTSFVPQVRTARTQQKLRPESRNV